MTIDMKNTLLSRTKCFLETNLHCSRLSKLAIKKYLPCRCPCWFQDTYYFHCSTSSRPLIGQLLTKERDSALIGNVLNKWYVMWCCAVFCCAAFRFVVLHCSDHGQLLKSFLSVLYPYWIFRHIYICVSSLCCVRL